MVQRSGGNSADVGTLVVRLVLDDEGFTRDLNQKLQGLRSQISGEGGYGDVEGGEGRGGAGGAEGRGGVFGSPTEEAARAQRQEFEKYLGVAAAAALAGQQVAPFRFDPFLDPALASRLTFSGALDVRGPGDIGQLQSLGPQGVFEPFARLAQQQAEAGRITDDAAANYLRMAEYLGRRYGDATTPGYRPDETGRLGLGSEFAAETEAQDALRAFVAPQGQAAINAAVEADRAARAIQGSGTSGRYSTPDVASIFSGNEYVERLQSELVGLQAEGGAGLPLVGSVLSDDDLRLARAIRGVERRLYRTAWGPGSFERTFGQVQALPGTDDIESELNALRYGGFDDYESASDLNRGLREQLYYGRILPDSGEEVGAIFPGGDVLVEALRVYESGRRGARYDAQSLLSETPSGYLYSEIPADYWLRQFHFDRPELGYRQDLRRATLEVEASSAFNRLFNTPMDIDYAMLPEATDSSLVGGRFDALTPYAPRTSNLTPSESYLLNDLYAYYYQQYPRLPGEPEDRHLRGLGLFSGIGGGGAVRDLSLSEFTRIYVDSQLFSGRPLQAGDFPAALTPRSFNQPQILSQDEAESMGFRFTEVPVEELADDERGSGVFRGGRTADAQGGYRLSEIEENLLLARYSKSFPDLSEDELRNAIRGAPSRVLSSYLAEASIAPFAESHAGFRLFSSGDDLDVLARALGSPFTGEAVIYDRPVPLYGGDLARYLGPGSYLYGTGLRLSGAGGQAVNAFLRYGTVGSRTFSGYSRNDQSVAAQEARQRLAARNRRDAAQRDALARGIVPADLSESHFDEIYLDSFQEMRVSGLDDASLLAEALAGGAGGIPPRVPRVALSGAFDDDLGYFLREHGIEREQGPSSDDVLDSRMRAALARVGVRTSLSGDDLFGLAGETVRERYPRSRGSYRRRLDRVEDILTTAEEEAYARDSCRGGEGRT